MADHNYSSVENAYILAQHMAVKAGGTPRAMFMVGLRVGLAIACWRTGLGEAYIGLMHEHALQGVTSITLHDLIDFERRCMETIFNTSMAELPTIMESN